MDARIAAVAEAWRAHKGAGRVAGAELMATAPELFGDIVTLDDDALFRFIVEHRAHGEDELVELAEIVMRARSVQHEVVGHIEAELPMAAFQ